MKSLRGTHGKRRTHTFIWKRVMSIERTKGEPVPEVLHLHMAMSRNCGNRERLMRQIIYLLVNPKNVPAVALVGGCLNMMIH